MAPESPEGAVLDRLAVAWALRDQAQRDLEQPLDREEREGALEDYYAWHAHAQAYLRLAEDLGIVAGAGRWSLRVVYLLLARDWPDHQVMAVLEDLQQRGPIDGSAWSHHDLEAARWALELATITGSEEG